MSTPILRVRDAQGNYIPIPAIQGRDGVDGKDGKDGAPGPNLINPDTLTPLSGILMGAGGSVKLRYLGLITPHRQQSPPSWTQTTTPAPSIRPPRPGQRQITC